MLSINIPGAPISIRAIAKLLTCSFKSVRPCVASPN